MTAAVNGPVRLTVDQLRAVAVSARLAALPTVLGLGALYPSTGRHADGVRPRPQEKLDEANLTTAGQRYPGIDAAISALGRPERELAMRLVTPDGIGRFSAVRRENSSLLAGRVGEVITIDDIDPHSGLPGVVTELLAVLPSSRPAEVLAVTAPLDDFTECLRDSHDSRELADRIRTLGVETRTAMALGAALGSRQAFAEIVYYTFVPGEGRVSRSSGAVAVFYTKRGRIVSAPSVSPSGEPWITLKAGSDHVVRQAINQLVSLSDIDWATPVRHRGARPGRQPRSNEITN
ncbi:ESX secretion-associated protein EspG [Mycobacterium sp. 3519A]|uniref:ESX secretion-associated protein EspG n=1 Tax=Mycobacterium sp. 3519A TaxID=2057184 RepID=UPI000C7CBFB2|nr:ESX secretion-associated protein EspG [Mycobacterium sp. 3519A]